MDFLRRPFWVKNKLRIIASHKNAQKIKAENNSENKEKEKAASRCYLHEPLVFCNLHDSEKKKKKRTQNKIKDLLHYLVLQVKYFQATGYTGDCYI